METNFSAGVDIGGTTIKAALISPSGNVKIKKTFPTDKRNNGKNIPTDLIKMIYEMMREVNISKNNITGIGVGVPGPIAYEDGVVYHTPNIPWPKNFPLKKMIEEEINVPVFLENDANCAALGELWMGAGKNCENVICITLGTGVGGGIITNGEIVRGSGGAAGEIGHVVAVLTGGARCNCGNKGCLETVASATGITRLAKERLTKTAVESILAQKFKKTGKLSAKDVFDCAKGGDELSNNIVNDVSFYLGVALANLANSLNPEKIIIGGGVSKAGDFFLKKISSYFHQFTFPQVKKTTILSLASLGNDAGVIGAASLVKKYFSKT